MEQEKFAFAGSLASKADQWTALIVTGHNFFQQGRLQEASKIFEGLAVIDTHNPYIHGILGSIYQNQKKYDLALIRYDHAIALYPDDIQALVNRGEIHLTLGNFQQAAEDLKRAIDLDPGKKDSAANRARLLVAIVKEAITTVEREGMPALKKVGARLSR
jgi:tetratricopeptide (TPR) repeat protein